MRTFLFARFCFIFLDEFRGLCCEGFRTHILLLLRSAETESSGANQTGICQAHNSGVSQFSTSPGGATVEQQDVEEAEEGNRWSRLEEFLRNRLGVRDRQARDAGEKSAGRNCFKSLRRLRGDTQAQ